MNTITPTVGTLSHRLYLIWLAEGTDLFDDQCGNDGHGLPSTPRARRAVKIFGMRTGQSMLSYHLEVCQREWKKMEAQAV